MDLVEFLRARLDDDAAKARAALAARTEAEAGPVDLSTGAPSHVQVATIERWSAPSVDAVIGEREASVRMPRGTIRVNAAGDGPSAAACAEHIARHDPGRVLREVEAKREIVDQHGPTEEETCRLCLYLPLPCITLRLLAQAYDWHKDYDEEWRP